MDVETKVELASRPPCEEVVTQDELKQLFETKSKPVHYIGLEVSGMLHLGSLFANGFKIRDLQKAGCECTVFLADWHSVINNKLEGDWEKIRKASQYYEEAFKFFCPGVKIVRGTESYHNNDEYWKNVVEFSRHVTTARATRCVGIMGRNESDSLSVAQFLYPSMQAVDIKLLGVDIAHAGMDQRKVHMLAREVFPKMGWKVPVALHHHILPGLLEPEKAAVPQGTGNKEAEVAASKMSKSKPDSAIFIHDSKELIESKLKKAFCPPKIALANPVLEMVKYLVMREASETSGNPAFSIQRPEKFGGNKDYHTYAELEQDFVQGALHPSDLKNACAKSIDELVSPVRTHFEKHKDLLDVYGQIQITR